MIESATGVARYTTIAGEHRHELEIRRSRFIAVLQRVETEDEAREFIQSLRHEFHDARHHCSAFVLGPTRAVLRSNDDGEPSGTAGHPMLEAITRRETASGRSDLSDIVAVVVRYFGGVLLGAGGLVRAYSDSVSQALNDAPLIACERLRLLDIQASPGTVGRVENELRALGTPVLGVRYGADSACLTVAVPDETAAVDAFRSRLAGVSAGGLTATTAGRRWVDGAGV